jgi:hypothetical protein
MGAGLALRVYEGPYAGLGHAARHVLVRMALCALDADPEPSYWAGWQPLSEALCLRGKEETNRTMVRRYMRELHAVGAITLTEIGNQYHRTTYRLWLNMPAPRQSDGSHADCLACPRPVDNSPLAVDNSLSTGEVLGAPCIQANASACMHDGPVPVCAMPPLIRRSTRSNKIRSIKGKGGLKLVQPVDNPEVA